MNDYAKKQIDALYEKANKIQPGEMDAFIEEVMGQDHDYNTVVEAVAACAVAAARAADRSPNGGITGFQASCVMWRFIQKYMSMEGPMKLVQYQNLLFPQYDYHFDKTIDPDTWKWLQEEAAKKIRDVEYAHPDVRAHWQSIVKGKVPFGYVVRER